MATPDTVRWQGTAPLVAQGLPALVRGSPVDGWRAHQQWNMQSLPAILPKLRTWNATFPVFAFFAETGRLGGQHGHRTAGLHVPITVAEGSPEGISICQELYMDGAELVTAIGAASESARGGNSSFLYASTDLEDIHDTRARERILSDLSPLDPLGIAAGTSEPKVDIVKLWVQSRDSVTHAHYDWDHNMFTQLVGTKRVWLWPPSQGTLAAMRPFPPPHSEDRQSQLDVPHVEVPPSHEVVLAPGDLLYLPPLWWHQLEVRDAISVSLSVWTRPGPSGGLDALDALPLPWGRAHTHTERVLRAARYIRRLVIAYHASADAARATIVGLVVDFDALVSRPPVEREGLLASEAHPLEHTCAEPTAGADGPDGTELWVGLEPLVQRAVAEVRNIAPPNTEAAVARELRLRSYLTGVSSRVVGDAATHAFLRTCVLASEEWGRPEAVTVGASGGLDDTNPSSGGAVAEVGPAPSQPHVPAWYTLPRWPNASLEGALQKAGRLQRKGKPKAAEKILRATWMASRELLGAAHEDTLSALGSLASMLQAKGEAGGEEAVALWRQALEASEIAHGRTSESSVSKLGSLVRALVKFRRYDEALPLALELAPLSRRC